jgi:hypothetical protein
MRGGGEETEEEEEKKNAYKLLMRKPEGKRSLERPGRGWVGGWITMRWIWER